MWSERRLAWMKVEPLTIEELVELHYFNEKIDSKFLETVVHFRYVNDFQKQHMYCIQIAVGRHTYILTILTMYILTIRSMIC